MLTNAFYLLEGIGNQLLADAVLVAPFPNVSLALQSVGFQLASGGFDFAFAASMETTAAAQLSLNTLLEKAVASRAQAPPPAQPAGPTVESLDPGLLFGTWERMTNVLIGERITYRFTRTDWVKVNTTRAADGSQDTEQELHPGAVTVYVNHRRPPSGTAEEDRILVKVVVANDQIEPLTLTFHYVRASLGGGPVLDLLVGFSPEPEIFVKTS